MGVFARFSEATARIREEFRVRSYRVHTERWQGSEIGDKPEAEMRELLMWSFNVPLQGFEDLDHWRADIKPNLPWADRHFELERVSGYPINPGATWKEWPYAHSADKHRTEGEQFNHTYAERYWPKFAGPDYTKDGDLTRCNRNDPLSGIRYQYADLNDLVDHLARNPLTRQAYLPVWFPEDGSHDDRKPCSLGYHFIHRGDYLHVDYYIRSCDFVRHFADDCYLTVRLLLWILDRLRKIDSRWKDVKPGMFKMDITSLHMFTNDYHRMFPKEKP